MPPPQTNAVVTRIQAAAIKEDGPAAPGADRWAGEARAYYGESRSRELVGEVGARPVLRGLIVAAGDVVAPRSGDVVTFARDGQAAETRTVKGVDGAELGGIPSALQTYRLELES